MNENFPSVMKVAIHFEVALSDGKWLKLLTLLGEASIKKPVFFSSEKLRNPETPPPPSSNLEAPVFSDKDILELGRPPPPPPFRRKIPKYSQFFMIKSLWIE